MAAKIRHPDQVIAHKKLHKHKQTMFTLSFLWGQAHVVPVFLFKAYPLGRTLTSPKTSDIDAMEANVLACLDPLLQIKR